MNTSSMVCQQELLEVSRQGPPGIQGIQGIQGMQGWQGLPGEPPPGPIVFYTSQITTNTNIPATHNGHSVGPIQINPGVTVSISPGARWVIA